MGEGPLKVAIVTEGKPGHLTQSRGIVELIDAEKEVREITVNLDLSPEESMIRGLTGFHCLAGFPKTEVIWQNAKQHINDDDINYLFESKPDLVVSAGTIPASYNILLKKLFKCKNIVAMRPSLLPLSVFDLVVLPTHDVKGDDGKNVISIDTSPNQCRPENIAPLGQDFAKEHGIDPDGGCWSLFLGGPSKVRNFPSDLVIELTRAVLSLAKKHDAKMIVTTSRRTEEEFEKVLRAVSMEYRDQIAFLQIFSDMPEPTTKPILALSEKVFITEDSVSMASESLWAKRETCLIELPSKTLGVDKIDRFKKSLLEKNFISVLREPADIEKVFPDDAPEIDWTQFEDIKKLSEAVNSLI